MIGPRLKDLGHWCSGGTPPSSALEHWSGDVPWISGKDFARTQLREPTKFVTRDAAERYSRWMPGGRTVLVLVRGMALVHGLPVARLPFDAAVNQDVRALRVGDQFDPSFVYYSMLGHRSDLNAHVERAAHGTARVRESLYEHRLPWPSIGAQQSIVNFLDEVGGQIAESLRSAARISDQVHDARAASRFEILIGVGRDRREWQTRSLGSLVDMRPGRSIPTSSIRERGTYPVFGGNGVRGFTDAYTHKGRHVLIGRQGALCGNVHDASGAFWASEHAVVVRPGPETNGDWLSARLEVMNLNQYSEAAAQPGLAVERLRHLRIAVPPLAEQAELVSELLSDEAVDRARSGLEQAISTLTTYRDSLIHEAVTGKLDVTRVSDAQMDERLHAAVEGRLDEARA